MTWLTARYEDVVSRLEQNHHFPWIMSVGCCSHEIQNSSLATYDWQRLGVDDVSTDPTQSNLLILGGWINTERAQEIKYVYDQMRKPTAVIAIGACAISGSPYKALIDAPSVHGEVIKAEDIVPVDIYVAGCPPRPESILSSILELQKKLKPGPSHREVLSEALRN